VVEGSPRFLDAHLLAATVALNTYENTKKPEFLLRARAFMEPVPALAPDDPNQLGVAIRLAITEEDWPRADQLLNRLETLVPGNPLVAIQRAQIDARRGRIKEAIATLRLLVERRPAWRDLFFLSDLEMRSGEVEPARRHLEDVLELVPGNTWALAKLGELELLYGDLERAERIYQELVQSGPQRSDLTNLGLVRFLLGRFDQAAVEYRRALALEPGHVTVTLNLADAELALGHRAEAQRLYREVLSSLEEKERGAPLTGVERMIRAQCLAQLGEVRPAVEIVLDSLQRTPEDVEVIYQAALVFALTGEKTSALAMTRKALALGTQARWFRIPGFDSLRSDPAFRALLEEKS
jgi:serine/threonine-protein kinase